MPTYQTAAQRSETLLIGSVKAEISTDDVTYYNIGLGRSFNITENVTPFNIQADNGPDPIEGVAEHELAISFEMLEFYLPNLNWIRGGIDTLTAVSAGAASAIDQYGTASTQADFFYAFAEQGTGSAPTSVVITQDTAGSPVTLTEGTSYHIIQNSLDVWGFVFISNGTQYDQTKDQDVNYDYTAVASRNLSSGGKTTISPRYWKFTNRKLVSGSLKERVIKIYSATLAAGMAMAFVSDNADDPVTPIPISLTAKLDTSRTVGDQLFLIEDQVGTA